MKDKRRALDLDRFHTIVDAYGADPSRWPEAERTAALSLLASSSESKATVDEAAQLDRMLDRVPMLQPSPQLERIVAAIPESNSSTSSSYELGNWLSTVSLSAVWKTAVAATLAVVLGIITGVATLDPIDDSTSSADWEDFASLAFVSDMDQELVP